MVVDSGSFWTLLLPSTFGRLDEVITKAMVPLNFSRGNSRGPSYICFTSRADMLNFNQTLSFQRLVHIAGYGDRRRCDATFAAPKPFPQQPRPRAVHKLREDWQREIPNLISS
jgi:hypothetical protein